MRALAIALAAAALAATVPAAAQTPPSPPRSWVQPQARLGVEVQALSEELRAFFEAPADRGVLVSRVEPGSAADEAGLRVGDVVIEAAGEPVAETLDLVLAVARVPEGGTLELVVLREGERRTLSAAPAGEPPPWGDLTDPERWREMRRKLREGVEEGVEQFRRGLEELERRLDELERELEEAPPPPDVQRT